MYEKNKIWELWFRNESSKLEPEDEKQKPKRRYLHFDQRISKLDEKKTFELLRPENVVKHSFFPFIRLDTKEQRYRRKKGHAHGDKTRELTIKLRPIDYAAHLDSIIFSWYSNILSHHYEEILKQKGLGSCVIAYRSFKNNSNGKGMTNADFAKDVFEFARSKQKSVVIAEDVTGFYENINHAILKRYWARIMNFSTLPSDHWRVFRAITDYRIVRAGRIKHLVAKARMLGNQRICTTREFRKLVVEKHLLERPINIKESRGIPQGSTISCVLANIYMIDFDEAVNEFVCKRSGLYRRYSDDLLIVCSPEFVNEISAFVMQKIQELKLEIKKEKEEIVLFESKKDAVTLSDFVTNKKCTMQYLGIETDGKRYFIRSSSLARFHRRNARIIRKSTLCAQGKGRKAPRNWLYKKQIKPGRNFIGYTKRVAKTLDSRTIAKQISPVREGKRLRARINKLEAREKNRRKM